MKRQVESIFILHYNCMLMTQVLQRKILNFFLENTGTYDANSSDMPARAVLGSEIRNLDPNKKQDLPDIVIHYSSELVNDYNNTDLIPGMFPSLFPWGIGGFNDSTCPTPISL